MKVQTVALAGAIALLAGVAVAQTSTPQPGDAPRPLPSIPPQSTTQPPPLPPGGFRPGGPEMRGGPEMHGEMRRGPFHGGPGGFGGPSPAKGTFLRVDRDGAFTLKCADEDSTRACMEAAAPVLDKLIQARQSAPK